MSRSHCIFKMWIYLCQCDTCIHMFKYFSESQIFKNDPQQNLIFILRVFCIVYLILKDADFPSMRRQLTLIMYFKFHWSFVKSLVLAFCNYGSKEKQQLIIFRNFIIYLLLYKVSFKWLSRDFFHIYTMTCLNSH